RRAAERAPDGSVTSEVRNQLEAGQPMRTLLLRADGPDVELERAIPAGPPKVVRSGCFEADLDGRGRPLEIRCAGHLLRQLSYVAQNDYTWAWSIDYQGDVPRFERFG